VGETRLRFLGNVESDLGELKVKRRNQRANDREEIVSIARRPRPFEHHTFEE
jgi:hypothetical protein